MKQNSSIFIFLFFASQLFAQIPAVTSTTHWQVYDGNSTWVPSALDFKNYCLSGLAGLLPAGGTTGQVPTKNSGTDYDYSWATPSGGGGDFLGTGFTSGGGSGTIPDGTQITFAEDGTIFAGKSIWRTSVPPDDYYEGGIAWDKFMDKSTALFDDLPGSFSWYSGTDGGARSFFQSKADEFYFEFGGTSPGVSQSYVKASTERTTIFASSSSNSSSIIVKSDGIISFTPSQYVEFGNVGAIVPPLLTSSAKEALTPSNGWMVYDTDLDGTCIYDGTKWLRISQKSTPTVAVGAGAGSGASATVTGNDIEGIVTLTTGTTPTTSAVLFTVTWNDSYSTAPIAVMMTGNSSNAVNLPGGRIPYVSSVGTTTFVASNPSINGLADATVYVFNYRTIQ